MGELTFFLGLQVKQKEDVIFISHDKYMPEILKKFGFTDVKKASTLIETQKHLLKDKDGEKVDVHLYRSMIGSLMYLTSSRPDIMFAVCACARYQVNLKVSHLHAVKRIFRYLKGQPKLGLWYPKDSPFDLDTLIVIMLEQAWIGSLQQEHIEIRHHFIRDSNEKKLIQMIKIHNDKNVADLLTKEFDKGIGVNDGDSKLMLLGINLLLLEKVNAARHNLLLLVSLGALDLGSQVEFHREIHDLNFRGSSCKNLFVLSSSNRGRLLGFTDLMRQKNKRMKQEGLIQHYGILEDLKSNSSYLLI
ncbi:hypothetical protein Tco_0471821 [Tanacetum coccineum]